MIVIGLLAAIAAPVYLDCTVSRVEGGPFIAEVALDEANQRATVSLDTGRVVVRQAVFAPDQVRIPDQEMTWTISRVDLTIRRTMSFLPPDHPGESGKCKIKPTPPKRAF